MAIARWQLSILVAATGLLPSLAGCGLDAPTADEPTPAPAPSFVAPPDPSIADAKRIVAMVNQQVQVVRNWTGEAHCDVIAPDGIRDYNVSRISYKRPGTTAATLLDARDHRKVGTKVVFDGVGQVRLRTYFFGFIPLRITLAVNDDRLLDSYKRSLKDTSSEQLMQVMMHPQAESKWLGSYQMDNERLEMLEFHSPASWKDLSREVVGISDRTMLPIYRDCFDHANRKIFHMEIRGMRTNVAFGSNEFTVD